MVNKDENVLKCTPCGLNYCPSDFDDDFSVLGSFFYAPSTRNDSNTTDKIINDLSAVSKVEGFINEDWINAYCLITDLGVQIQYFPFLVLLMAICLCLVQKVSNT